MVQAEAVTHESSYEFIRLSIVHFVFVKRVRCVHLYILY